MKIAFDQRSKYEVQIYDCITQRNNILTENEKLIADVRTNKISEEVVMEKPKIKTLNKLDSKKSSIDC